MGLENVVKVVKDYPEPPEHLTEEQAEIWNSIVKSLPMDWFPSETHGLLEQYCRHAVAARRIGAMISELEGKKKLDFQAYNEMLKAQDREGKAMGHLARQMRISQLSTYEKKKKKPSQRQRPWDG